MKKYLVSLLFLVVFSCGDSETSAPECREIEEKKYTNDTGWGASDYCEAPTKLGCFPFFGSSSTSCKSFHSMRTASTPDTGIDACKTLMGALNCNAYTSENGDSIRFSIEHEGELRMHIFGKIDGVSVDTSLFLNPCQTNCLSGISLETINPIQQKICEIPRQGLPKCLFPDSAHNITFRQADAHRVNIVLGGKDHLLTKN